MTLTEELTIQLLCPRRQKPWPSLNKRLGEHQIRSARFSGGKKTSFAHCRNRFSYNINNIGEISYYTHGYIIHTWQSFLGGYYMATRPFAGMKNFRFVGVFLKVHTSNTICVGLWVFGTYKESKTSYEKNTLSTKDNNKTCNVCITQRRGAFVQRLLLWKRNKYYIFWECKYSLRHPACNAHEPYGHLLPVWLYNIFPHYLINYMIFKKSHWK
jgi:hypothetical protein